MDVKFTLHGAEELERAMKELAAIAGDKAARSVGASALRAGARVVVNEAKRRAPQPGSAGDPYSTGELRDNLAARMRRTNLEQSLVIQVGILKPVSRRLHFTEFGVPSRGIPAEPFIRPALDEKKEEALQALADQMARGLRRALERKVRPAS